MDLHEAFKPKMMQKKEPYEIGKPLRLIGICPTNHTLGLAGFALQFSKLVLKQHEWYLSGYTPTEIAEKVNKFCDGKRRVFQTDYSKFDGHIHTFMRNHVVLPCMKRFFNHKHHPELIKRFKEEQNCNIKMCDGEVYVQCGYARFTGSPMTTPGNGVIHGFDDYAARRRKGMSPQESWDNMGLVSGDDGLRNGDCMDQEDYQKSSEDFGLKLEFERTVLKEDKDRRITFLARTYLDPFASINSIQDLKRALAKANLTISLQENASESQIKRAIIAKASGYLITDKYTPILSHYYRALLRSIGAEYDEGTINDEDTTINYFARVFKQNTWPQEKGDTDALWNAVTKALGITKDQALEHISKLEAVRFGDPVPTLELTKENHDYAAPVEITRCVNGRVYTEFSGVGDSTLQLIKTIRSENDPEREESTKFMNDQNNERSSSESRAEPQTVAKPLTPVELSNDRVGNTSGTTTADRNMQNNLSIDKSRGTRRTSVAESGVEVAKRNLDPTNGDDEHNCGHHTEKQNNPEVPQLKPAVQATILIKELEPLVNSTFRDGIVNGNLNLDNIKVILDKYIRLNKLNKAYRDRSIAICTKRFNALVGGKTLTNKNLYLLQTSVLGYLVHVSKIAGRERVDDCFKKKKKPKSKKKTEAEPTQQNTPVSEDAPSQTLAVATEKTTEKKKPMKKKTTKYQNDQSGADQTKVVAGSPQTTEAVAADATNKEQPDKQMAQKRKGRSRTRKKRTSDVKTKEEKIIESM
jgi:hypothetical protein